MLTQINPERKCLHWLKFYFIQVARFHLLSNQINGITHPPEDFVVAQRAEFVKSGHSLDNCKAMI